MMDKDEFRKNSFSGTFATERGYIRISEDYLGERYHIETWDNLTKESQRMCLRGDEIFALAKAGLIANAFGITELTDRSYESNRDNEERQRKLDEIRRAFSSRGGISYDYFSSRGDVPFEYYDIEGLGTQRLDGFDFYADIKYK